METMAQKTETEECMDWRKAAFAVALAALLLLPGAALSATFNACDNFGQDWKITLGPFGGTFPGTLLVSGCRDCDGSLGCGGPLPLDGTIVVSGGGQYFIWSVTAYRPVGSNTCVSSHWTGSDQVPFGPTVAGNVSNEFGPFGAFTLTTRPCSAAIPSMDPALHSAGPTWSQLPQ
jgi:hypothetical protein